MRISVVTPWLGHEELADDYFEAVLPELDEGDECLVVDDGSDPPLAFGSVRSHISRGFCAACNLGLQHARNRAVLFLNNDVALGKRGWLAPILEALEPGVLVGHLRYDAHGDVDGRKLPYLDGWCLAGLRDDLLALGGFDETLAEPAYYSDNLLCLEARAAGMTLRGVPIGLRHLENVTAGRAHEPSVREAATANRARYQARARELLVAA